MFITKGFAKGGKVGRYTRDDIPNFLEKIFNKDFIAKCFNTKRPNGYKFQR